MQSIGIKIFSNKTGDGNMELDAGSGIHIITNGWVIGFYSEPLYRCTLPSLVTRHTVRYDGEFFVKRLRRKPIKFGKLNTTLGYFSFENFIKVVYWIASQKGLLTEEEVEKKVIEIIYKAELSRLRGDERRIMFMKKLLTKKFDIKEILCRKMIIAGYKWLRSHPEFSSDNILKLVKGTMGELENQFLRAITDRLEIYPLGFGINMDKVFEGLYLISQRGLQKFLQEV